MKPLQPYSLERSSQKGNFKLNLNATAFDIRLGGGQIFSLFACLHVQGSP